MTEPMHSIEGIDVAVRDAAAAGDGRTIEGIAVTYGQPVRGRTREYGDAVETFEQGAFRDVVEAVARGERIPIVDEHNGEVVGYADRLADGPDGLRFAGRLLTSTAARDFAERVGARVMRISVEFLPGEIRRAAHAVTHTRVRALGALAGSYFPAYAGTSASVRAVEDPPMPEITEPVIEAVATRDADPSPPVTAPAAVSTAEVERIATEIAQSVMRSFAERGVMGAPTVDPFAEWRGLSLGQMAQRTLGVGEFEGRGQARADAGWLGLATRTVADTVTTSGANAGMVTPGVVTEVHGIVSRGRPAIAAFGGPRPVPTESGMSIDWPYFDGTLSSLVGAQSAQKAEITSAAVDVKKGTEALNTYAGGSDISYQLLRRSTRPYLDTYFAILLTAWGVVTDAAFVTELESGSVTSDFAEALSGVDATEFKNLLVDASIAVQTATGLPAEFALASTTAFTQFAKLYTPIVSQPSIANTGLGAVDLAGLNVNVGNIPLIHVPSITAGKIIVSNRQAAAWYEDGPFQAQDEDVMHLGRDVAIWSMGAGARFIPAGIIEMYDVTP
jgi:hypothetical protein